MTPRINPIAPRLKWDVLSPAEIERMHEATLTIMEGTGIRFPSPRALDILEKGGCRVDRAQQLAKLPRAVVMEAVAQAPREYVLAGRDPACDMLIDGRHCYLSNDGSGVFVFDRVTGEKRPSTKADAAESARFVDALPAVSYYWGPVVTSQDVPAATKALHDAEAVLTNTSKHFQTVTTVGEKPARYLVEMAAAIAGGTDELRRRPIISFMQCAVDPLGHDGPNLEANLVAAEHGLASGFMPMPLAAGTGPATLAGNLVVQNAEALSGVVLLQLAYPGAPCFFAGAPSVIDLKTGGYTGGSPEDYLLAAAATQLAHFYGLPMAMGTMATGAKEPDWQAAVDDSLSTFASVMTSADMMNGCGLLNGSKILSYPHMVMETEIYRIVQKMAGRHRGRRRDAGPGRDRPGRRQRHLPGREAHAPAHEGDLAADPVRPHAVRRVAARRQAGRLGEGDRDRRGDPRRLPSRAAGRRRVGRDTRHRGARRRRGGGSVTEPAQSCRRRRR